MDALLPQGDAPQASGRSGRLARHLRRLYRRFAYRPERHYMRHGSGAAAHAAGQVRAPR